MTPLLRRVFRLNRHIGSTGCHNCLPVSKAFFRSQYLAVEFPVTLDQVDIRKSLSHFHPGAWHPLAPDSTVIKQISAGTIIPGSWHLTQFPEVDIRKRLSHSHHGAWHWVSLHRARVFAIKNPRIILSLCLYCFYLPLLGLILGAA